MFRRFLQLLHLGPKRRARLDLPTFDRSQITSFLSTHHGLPQMDWGALAAWIAHTSPDPSTHADLRRAAAAAWLDELRDALPEDHRRWRTARVEGLAPLDPRVSQRTAKAANNAFTVIERALAPIRGTPPIPPIAVVALATRESYYSFQTRESDEGESATSGGVYINDGPDSFPLIVLPVQVRHSIEDTIAHELTHHALHGAGLPLWIEEGLTQMMEERVTGRTDFRINAEMLSRQRDHWLDGELDTFLSGSGFSSPHGDEQELSYHLSQLVVRGLLSRDAARFFAFARACKITDADDAAATHLGDSLHGIVEESLSASQ